MFSSKYFRDLPIATSYQFLLRLTLLAALSMVGCEGTNGTDSQTGNAASSSTPESSAASGDGSPGSGGGRAGSDGDPSPSTSPSPTPDPVPPAVCPAFGLRDLGLPRLDCRRSYIPQSIQPTNDLLAFNEENGIKSIFILHNRDAYPVPQATEQEEFCKDWLEESDYNEMELPFKVLPSDTDYTSHDGVMRCDFFCPTCVGYQPQSIEDLKPKFLDFKDGGLPDCENACLAIGMPIPPVSLNLSSSILPADALSEPVAVGCKVSAESARDSTLNPTQYAAEKVVQIEEGHWGLNSNRATHHGILAGKITSTNIESTEYEAPSYDAPHHRVDIEIFPHTETSVRVWITVNVEAVGTDFAWNPTNYPNMAQAMNPSVLDKDTRQVSYYEEVNNLEFTGPSRELISSTDHDAWGGGCSNSFKYYPHNPTPFYTRGWWGAHTLSIKNHKITNRVTDIGPPMKVGHAAWAWQKIIELEDFQGQETLNLQLSNQDLVEPTQPAWFYVLKEANNELTVSSDGSYNSVDSFYANYNSPIDGYWIEDFSSADPNHPDLTCPEQINEESVPLKATSIRSGEYLHPLAVPVQLNISM